MTSTYLPRLVADLGDVANYLHVRSKGVGLAIEALERGERVVLHVNWEEFIYLECSSEDEARRAREHFQNEVRRFRGAGGAIVWTVHNGVPHHIPFTADFLALRAFLGLVSDVILVHNSESIRVLERQFALAHSKVQRFTYPSYFGWPETRQDVERALGAPVERRVQFFGTLRMQKNYTWSLQALAHWFLRKRDLTLRISGQGPDAAGLLGENPLRRDVHWDIRRVPDDEVPVLLRTAACVVVAYREFLTSGVAMLVLSAGGVLIGPDSSQLRELLPPEGHRFLFTPGKKNALRDAVDAVLALSETERAALIAAGLDVADAARPAVGARELGQAYARALARLSESGDGQGVLRP
jgi:glycosyltransferase involved in cell wall biosynthesis